MRYIRTVVVALFFSLFIVTVLLFCPSSGFAQGKEIIAEGTYNMGDGETPAVAESRAVLQAKRIALEEAGTYVVSYSKIENLQLTADEIKVLTAGLMEVTILDKKRTIVGDGINFWIKIKAIVQIEKMTEMAKRVKENTVVEDYKKIQEAYDKSQKEIEELKRQLAGAKGEKEKKQVETKITDKERLFQAEERFDKGYKYILNDEYDKAIEAYTSAIALDSNNAIAYYFRGVAYSFKGQYDRGIEDFNKAIELDPNDADIYLVRGSAYAKKGQYDRGIEDYNKAIALDPNSADIYFILGVFYFLSENRDRAISDFQKACDMGDELGCEELQKALQIR